jgi:hypothetical protein
MSRKPLGYFRIPPTYWQMPEEERRAHAQVIADKLREALLAQADENTDAGGEPADDVDRQEIDGS